MKTIDSVKALLTEIHHCVDLSGDECKITDEKRFRDEAIDLLAYNMALSNDPDLREAIAYIVWEAAKALGIYPSSIHEFYASRGRGAWFCIHCFWAKNLPLW